MNKVMSIVVATVVLAGANLGVWYLANSTDPQIAWVCFVLVWLNLILGWLTLRRQPLLTALFFSAGAILELILIVNKFWISTRG